ncbi:ATPase [Gordoniibacillus kamchatkensis]|uniref:ATPase n=1 Tax=Gordoniibacillus kamchatkensis TaxID=1590651 RepID=A0ABR5ALW2_9BACL|nr:SRPBCC family protein [Paenibacillus sp. VKM B-2647]KIL41515.1 ATPase [Paenibacillus sp. VKM B-2647]
MAKSKAASDTVTSVQDRELIINRVFRAPRELVYQAWTDPEHLPHWWGPRGFTITVQEIDIRPGGIWRFVMHGPDGIDYDNKIAYHEVVRPERLAYTHGDSADDDYFQVTVTFAEAGDKTELTMRMLFKSAAHLEKVVREYGAIEGAKSTLDRLEEQLAKM